MKNKTLVLVAVLFSSSIAFANTIIVDKNGGGQFISVQTAVTNASTNDTIKVWPGTYNEQITINKNIVLMGSGYENTIISGNFDPIITISSGKILYFLISSLNGKGVLISGGVVSNCCIVGCSSKGIYNNTNGSTCTILNCIIYQNGEIGIDAGNNSTINVVNCISRNNSSYGFEGWDGTCYVSYSNGSRGSTSGNQGCIDLDPQFISNTDFHVSQGSPCWNTGNPSLSDPDGSRSDMGYFGGPDCPIYPTVFEIIITPNGNNINLEAKGRANY